MQKDLAFRNRVFSDALMKKLISSVVSTSLSRFLRIPLEVDTLVPPQTLSEYGCRIKR